MAEEPRDIQLRHLAEEMGILFQEMGGSAITGRILGRLLVSVPEQQSLTELAEYLGASKGAVSQATRQLVASGLIVKVPVPGTRSSYFRLRDNAWVQVSRSKVTYATMMRALADKAVALLADEDPAHRHRAEEMAEFYRFMEDAFPRLLEEWLQSRENPNA